MWKVVVLVVVALSLQMTSCEKITVEELEELRGLIQVSHITDQRPSQDPDHIWVHGCEWDQDYEPSEIEVNFCNVRLNVSTVCNDLMVTKCPNHNCLLGLKTDENGCVTSCRCKKQGLFQGDIMINEQDLPKLEDLFDLKPSEDVRAASRNIQRWKIKSRNGYYIVPYVMDERIRNNRQAFVAIKRAFYQFKKFTCIKFRRRKNDVHYVKFIADPDGCWSHVGLVGGEQLVSIGKGCERKGIVMHELMHTLGFFHEQSRPDRDDHVDVITENIEEGHENEFRKMSILDIDSMGSPYDTGSLMHYDGMDYSKQPEFLWTIVDKKTQRPVKAQRNGFSEQDIFQLSRMYDCY